MEETYLTPAIAARTRLTPDTMLCPRFKIEGVNYCGTLAVL